MPLLKPFTPLCCCKKRSLVVSLLLLFLLLLAWLSTRWKQTPQTHSLKPYRPQTHFSTARHDLSLSHEWDDTSSRVVVPPSLLATTAAEEDRHLRARFRNGESERTSNSSREGGARRRYVLGMNYWEQFNMAMKNYYNLACLAGHWNANVVLPFTHNSRLYGLEDVKLDEYFNTTSTARALDLIFDTHSLDKALQQKGLPAVRMLRDMLLHGSRKVVYLHFLAAKTTREYKIRSKETNRFLKQAFQSSSIVDCITQPELVELGRHITSKLNEQLVKIHPQRKRSFHVDKYYCVDMNHTSSPAELAARLGLSRVKNLSMVVINWRGTTKEPVVRVSAKGTHLNNRILMTDICSMGKSLQVPINFSRSVLDTSRRFLRQTHLQRDKYIVVHIRSEKLYLRQGRFRGLVGRCVMEALRIVEGLKMKDRFLFPLPVIYFYDLGQYGSETCKNCRVVRQLKDILHKNNIEITNFDPKVYNVTHDSGFVAAVEMESIARAKHLVLVGGGAFQSQAALRFEEYHSNLRTGSGEHERVWVCENDLQAAELMNRTVNTAPH